MVVAAAAGNVAILTLWVYLCMKAAQVAAEMRVLSLVIIVRFLTEGQGPSFNIRCLPYLHSPVSFRQERVQEDPLPLPVQQGRAAPAGGPRPHGPRALRAAHRRHRPRRPLPARRRRHGSIGKLAGTIYDAPSLWSKNRHLKSAPAAPRPAFVITALISPSVCYRPRYPLVSELRWLRLQQLELQQELHHSKTQSGKLLSVLRT